MYVLQEAIERLVLKRPELLDDPDKLADAVEELLQAGIPRVKVDQALRELETIWRKDPGKELIFSQVAIKWLVAWWKRYQEGKDEYPASNVLQKRSKNRLGTTLDWEIVQESRVQALGPWAKTLLRASQDLLKDKYQGPETIRQLLEAGKIKGILSSGDIWWTSKEAVEEFLGKPMSVVVPKKSVAPKPKECFGKRNKPATTCVACPELKPCTATSRAVPPTPGGVQVPEKKAEKKAPEKAPEKAEENYPWRSKSVPEGAWELLPIPDGLLPKSDQEIIQLLQQVLAMQKTMQASQERVEESLKRIENRIEVSLKEMTTDREVIMSTARFIRQLRDSLKGV